MSTPLEERLEFSLRASPSWASVRIEVAELDGIEYYRKEGSPIIYRRESDRFRCLRCGSPILAAYVARPVHDGPFPGSGFGECKLEVIPYCPSCEEKPDYNGPPILSEE